MTAHFYTWSVTIYCALCEARPGLTKARAVCIAALRTRGLAPCAASRLSPLRETEYTSLTVLPLRVRRFLFSLLPIYEPFCRISESVEISDFRAGFPTSWIFGRAAFFLLRYSCHTASGRTTGVQRAASPLRRVQGGSACWVSRGQRPLGRVQGDNACWVSRG